MSIFSKGYDGELVPYNHNELVPYYLRGYMAIDREMEMLDKRSIDKIELFDRDYSDVLLELQRVRQINPVRARDLTKSSKIYLNLEQHLLTLIKLNIQSL